MTIVVQVEELPLTSVTVKTSVFTPTSEQTKAVWLRAKVAIAQLSELPLFTAAAVVEPLPVLSSCTVTFWQSAIGGTVSRMVTMALQVLLLPLTSVTVRMTVLPLTFAQLNVVMFSAKFATPQASELPLLTIDGVIVALPVLFKLHRNILADSNRSNVVYHRDRRRASRRIAIDIGHRQDFRIRADLGADEARLAQRQAGDRAIVGAVVVDRGGRGRTVAGIVELNGDVLAKRNRRHGVADGHVALQVLLLPLTSVTVRMTVLPLTFAQLNVVMLSAKVGNSASV